jgi:replicative DNA helicase
MHAHDLEAAVLGVIASTSQIDVRDASGLVARLGLEPGLFHLPSHQAVYKASQGLLRAGLPVEPIAVYSRLSDAPEIEAAGGRAWLSDLLGQLPANAGSIGGYVATLRALALKRSITKELHAGLAKIAEADEPGVALVEISGALAGLTKSTQGLRTLGDFRSQVLGEIDKARSGERVIAIPTGIAELDGVIGGFSRGMLSIVGGTTGGGKSALFATSIEAAAKAGTRVGLISLEDQGTWIYWRLLSKASKLDQQRLRISPESIQGAEFDRVSDGADMIEEYASRIVIDDRPGLRPEEVVQSMVAMVVNYGCELIVIDHAGELNFGKPSDRLDLQIANALAMFRDVAKAHDVAVVVGTQVTMPKDVKPGTPPEAKHMKNSSELANKARLVLGIGRDAGGDVLKIRVCKNTNGPAGPIVEVPFHKSAAMVVVDEAETVFEQ